MQNETLQRELQFANFVAKTNSVISALENSLHLNEAETQSMRTAFAGISRSLDDREKHMGTLAFRMMQVENTMTQNKNSTGRKLIQLQLRLTGTNQVLTSLNTSVSTNIVTLDKIGYDIAVVTNKTYSMNYNVQNLLRKEANLTLAENDLELAVTNIVNRILNISGKNSLLSVKLVNTKLIKACHWQFPGLTYYFKRAKQHTNGNNA